MFADRRVESHEQLSIFFGFSLKSKKFSGVQVEKASRATRIGALGNHRALNEIKTLVVGGFVFQCTPNQEISRWKISAQLVTHPASMPGSRPLSGRYPGIK
jgi:hypothetical protein